MQRLEGENLETYLRRIQQQKEHDRSTQEAQLSHRAKELEQNHLNQLTLEQQQRIDKDLKRRACLSRFKQIFPVESDFLELKRMFGSKFDINISDDGLIIGIFLIKERFEGYEQTTITRPPVSEFEYYNSMGSTNWGEQIAKAQKKEFTIGGKFVAEVGDEKTLITIEASIWDYLNDYNIRVRKPRGLAGMLSGNREYFRQRDLLDIREHINPYEPLYIQYDGHNRYTSALTQFILNLKQL